MPQYGNSAGRNKGKKYKKLTGDEIATPEAERRAKHFINWYGAAHGMVGRGIRGFDPEVATDTMLQIYNDILYKDLRVGKYTPYFKRAYHTMKLKRAVEETRRSAISVCLDAQVKGEGTDITYAETIAAPDYDYTLYEQITEQMREEMIDYVRARYGPMEVSLFEIYVGLQPDVSYTSMGRMLGISANRIYLTISAIKRDLQENYTERRIHLLSML